MRVPAQADVEVSRPYIVHSSPRPKRRLWLFIAVIVAAVVLVAGIALFAKHWPFTREAVTRDLEQATSANVEIRNFRQTFFPPGAVAEGLTVRRGQRTPPLITLQRLTIRSSYPGMLRHRVSLLKAEGMHVIIGLGQSLRGKSDSGNSKTVIEQFQADEAVLDFIHADAPGRPARFAIHQLRMDDLGSHGAMKFEVALTNPNPKGEVRASGRLGPWNSGNPQETSVSGSYSFKNANLEGVKGIAGLLSSNGNFHGPISAIQVDGSTEIPGFEVANVQHPERMTTRFHGVV